ncbi:MAG TPA: L-threonylcarbamoyladenylate synthase [Candidatus Poseidoniaceae archaeon]|nr:MAG TPA: Sua5/YciO/YrdC/YwlC family protein [Candidatus Poseidoniales archaeon]HIH52898.1 L-threonylcarbamoyladenylate synthase [Candidatus Poseidoniaceae archaeon]
MDLERVIARLLADEAVVYPTTTLPGLGARPTPAGLDAVFALKARDDQKPVSLAVRNLHQASSVVDVPEIAYELVGAFPPGSLSLILPAKRPLDARLGGQAVAVRCVAHPTALALVDAVGPITATSANISGEVPALETTVNAERLGLPREAAAPGVCPGGLGSTFLLLDGDGEAVEVSVIRAGVIPPMDVEAWVTSRRA